MKTRTKVATLTLAILLVGSIAYAADRRRQARQAEQEPEPTHEEAALQAELLAATEEHQDVARTRVVTASKIVDDKGAATGDTEKPAEH